MESQCQLYVAKRILMPTTEMLGVSLYAMLTQPLDQFKITDDSCPCAFGNLYCVAQVIPMSVA